MSIGFGYIQKLLDTNTAPTILSEHGLSASHFVGDERAAIDFVINFFSQYGELPTREVISAGADITWTEMPDSPFEFWRDQIQERFTFNQITSGLQHVRDILREDDVQRAAGALQQLAVGLQSTLSGFESSLVADILVRVIERHSVIRESVDLIGISFGLPFLDEMTGGAQGGDFIVLASRPGVGKSYYFLHAALEAWRAGHRVMFVTLEMTSDQCVMRLAALSTGIPHTLIKIGRLSDIAVSVLRQQVAVFRENNDNFRFLEASLVGSVEDIILRIREYRPDVVFVDGAYMLKVADTKQRWDRVMSVAEELKKTCLRLSIPIFASYQQGRQAVRMRGGTEQVRGSLGTIMYSDAPGQLATIALDLRNDDAEVSQSFTLSAVRHKVMTVLKGREGESGSALIQYDMARMRIAQERIIDDA